MIKDKAPDNLWIATKDYQGYTLTPTPYSVIKKNPENVWGGSGAKLEGEIVYVKQWAKDSNGKIQPSGFKRMFKSYSGMYPYIDPSFVVPYYDYILQTKRGTSADIAQASDKVKNDKSSFTGEEDFSAMLPQPNFDIHQPMLDLNVSGEFDDSISNVFGKRNYKFPEMVLADRPKTIIGYEEQSNTIGSWFKDTFSGKSGGNVSPNDAKKIADPNRPELSADEMQSIHKNSGTNKSFTDWYENGGKGIIADTNNLLAVLTNNPSLATSPTGNQLPPPTTNPKGDSGKGSEVTILGMHPLTFGIVSLLSLSAVGITAYFIYKHKK